MSKLQLKTQNYVPIIGIEVHAELKNKSKMFCGCAAKHFRVKPNTHTCPVCLGLPGALPVPNKKAIDWCVMLGLALGCKISKESKFDRKNYFYPDLPKGYQISQYDEPFCKNGYVNLKSPTSKAGSQISNLKTTTKNPKLKEIRINRVHMEEDTGKLIHKKDATLIDFNRSGVPLAEVVTEPDINSSKEALLYLKKLQQIIRYLGISDADMEKGSMRCEVNISLKLKAKSEKQDLPKYKVEVKNINSFKFVKKAIEYEIKRQKKLLEKGITPKQETRGFDEKRGKTYSQRSKEEAHDYRYFPEPDIPPIRLDIKDIKILRNLLPEFPDKKIKRFIRDYGINEYNGAILAQTRKKADYFEKAVQAAQKNSLLNQRPRAEETSFIKRVANVIVNRRVDIKKYKPEELVEMLMKKTQGQVVDEKEIEKVVKKVLSANPKAVSDYKKGKTQVIGFLIGKVMKELGGKGNPEIIKKKIKYLMSN